jgi:hypothetical protein
VTAGVYIYRTCFYRHWRRSLRGCPSISPKANQYSCRQSCPRSVTAAAVVILKSKYKVIVLLFKLLDIGFSTRKLGLGNFLLVFASTVIVDFGPRGTSDHIFLSRDSDLELGLCPG